MAAADEDQDALTWEGDDVVVDLPDESDDTEAASEVVEPAVAVAAVSTPSRLTAGTLFVLALASAVGWITVVVQNPTEIPGLLGMAMYQLGEFISIIAAPLWWFTAGKIGIRVLTWRLVGLVVTAPWPLLASTLLGGAQ